ncbi:MAG: UbiD family decarboxylase [Acidobacteria bacterium]|nr:MAG: UbiD family decarboxylase [Acidobacteriota bacterium]
MREQKATGGKEMGYVRYTDLRGFVNELGEAGELQPVRAQVDWNLEVGALTRLICERRQPAPLFENIKDYPSYRMAGVLLGPGRPLHARLAMALGVDKETLPLELIEIVRQRLRAPKEPVKVERNEAPCKEVILQGDDANLLSLPCPWIKEIDGGRYVGTWDIVVIKDPETGWVNWGTYRCMVKDEQSFAVLLIPAEQHGGGILRKYQAMGKPMPIALVIGADPLSHLGAIAPLDHGMSEVAAAGGLRGEGVRLVRCETSDLEVPADAEIVIEAEIVPGEVTEEGPFGEYTGHRAHHGLSPLARVKCITHRQNPIFTMANMGKPWDDWAVPASILVSAVAKNRLEDHGIRIKACYGHAPVTTLVVSVNPRPGLTKKILSILMSGERLFLAGTGIVFVDEDVDVTNLEDVWWAITTRMHPDRFEVLRDLPANPLIPYLTPEDRQRHVTSQWVMEATFPADWDATYREAHTVVADFAHAWSEKVQRQVLDRWTEYGYGEIEDDSMTR